MILIYSNTTSPRLQYVCSFIFKELMGSDFSIINDREAFSNSDGTKINYSSTNIQHSTFNIQHWNLLFENDIKIQPIECFDINNYKAFFKAENSDFPFDIFAATFYLLSRYEEYLPHTKDMYGRYAHENSIAFKEGFLSLPLINIWIDEFAKALQEKNSKFKIQNSKFQFLPTYDIDIIYAYKHKGFVRNFGGAIKSLSTFNLVDFFDRINVLARSKKDPFDPYDQIDSLHQRYGLNPIYFFLVADKNSVYDKNVLPSTKAMQQLIKYHAKKYTIGIHPSWQSGNDIELLKKEKKHLAEISKITITGSRQHYIRFNLPDGYRRLIDAEISDDYSMGYGSINGFRASVASSFFWYDLEKEEQSTLRIHPFCFMEANAYYKQKLTATEAFDELMHYYAICKKVNGTLITIWHNQTLGTSKMFKGWGEMYEEFLAIAFS